MCIDAADKHAVFFDEAEAGGRFACAGEGVGVAGGAEVGEERGGGGGDAGAAGEGVEGDALAEEELADGAVDGGAVGFGVGGEGGAFGEVPGHAGGRLVGCWRERGRGEEGLRTCSRAGGRLRRKRGRLL